MYQYNETNMKHTVKRNLVYSSSEYCHLVIIT